MKTLKGFALGIIFLLLMAGSSNTLLSPQNALNILAKYSHINIALNTHQGMSRVVKFGYNLDVDTAASEHIVPWGGKVALYGLTARTLSVVSTSAADTSAGTGARTILIQCIDSIGAEVDLVVTLNGVTPVVTTQTCKFVNRALVFAAGTGRTNAGNINIIQTTSSVQLAQIPALFSVTQQLTYYVPYNKKCYIEAVRLTVVKNAGGQIPKVKWNAFIYSATQDVLYDIRTDYMDAAVSNYREVLDYKDQPLLPNEIMFFDLLTNQDNTEVTGVLDLICQEN